jgi:hypothetical protein
MTGLIVIGFCKKVREKRLPKNVMQKCPPGEAGPSAENVQVLPGNCPIEIGSAKNRT